jgi:hypothetical protein
MLERDLARDFTEIFREYQLWVPNNRTAGWPDRGVQINNSKIIWFELKLLTERLHTPTILVNSLAAEQAAWLSKWQMKGGHCFLFLGFVDQYSRNLVKYGIVRCGNWNTWLSVPRKPISLKQIQLFDNRMDVLFWFKDMFIPQSRNQKVTEAEHVTKI